MQNPVELLFDKGFIEKVSPNCLIRRPAAEQGWRRPSTEKVHGGASVMHFSLGLCSESHLHWKCVASFDAVIRLTVLNEKSAQTECVGFIQALSITQKNCSLPSSSLRHYGNQQWHSYQGRKFPWCLGNRAGGRDAGPTWKPWDEFQFSVLVAIRVPIFDVGFYTSLQVYKCYCTHELVILCDRI